MTRSRNNRKVDVRGVQAFTSNIPGEAFVLKKVGYYKDLSWADEVIIAIEVGAVSIMVLSVFLFWGLKGVV